MTRRAWTLLLALPMIAFADHERIVHLQDPVPEPVSQLVERVAVPLARIAVVSEVANALVVATQPGTNDHLFVFTLDEAGHTTTSTPVRVTLPRPEAIAKYNNFALSIAAHPTLPLLYVWQDVNGQQGAPPSDASTRPVYEQYDHLQIYRLEGGQAQLVLSTGQGPEYSFAMFHHGFGGALGLDTTNQRLFLPNLRDKLLANAQWGVLGFAQLDDQGLPVMRNGRMELTTQNPLGGSLPPVGLGWVVASTNRVVFVGPGVGTWDLASRRAPVGFMWLSRVSWRGQVAAHPSLPMLYIGWIDGAYLQATQLANGYPTLLPQEVNVPHLSGPVVMPKHNRVALGNANSVLLLRLTADGWFSPEAAALPVQQYRGEALCYSPKHDRLYVPVEKLE